jgi:protocatechuate 3,4-dioxygenase beta subunit
MPIKNKRMDRKGFLKGVGLVGLGLALPKTGFSAEKSILRKKAAGGACILVPTEIAGPFPLDLTENTFFFRQDVRESEPGSQLNLKMRVLGLENCEPMSNVRVNIWHCTNEGVYSGYNTNNNPGDVDATHLRGYQITDINGEVDFITAFPGWYPGRICHIHVQVFVSSSYSAVTQISFPIAEKNELYTNNSELYPEGEDPIAFNGDGAFVDGYENQVATLSDNKDGSYDSFIEFAVEGNGTVGVGHIERQMNNVFVLGQNFPKPIKQECTIPFTVHLRSDIDLEIWDLTGRKLDASYTWKKALGDYEAVINLAKLNLPSGDYVYQLVARNEKGVFRLPKRMSHTN